MNFVYEPKNIGDVENKHIKLAKMCAPQVDTLQFIDHYGIGFWLRRFARCPEWLPLYFFADHGPSLDKTILPYEIDSKFDKALFHNSFKVEDALSRKFSKVYVVGSGFVHYKNLNKISRVSNPKGTVVFPFHSTFNIDTIFDWEKYINELKSLPDKFHPLTICMHYVDIEKGLDRLFLKHGFNVVTAGHKNNIQFVQNFYEIIRDKKYGTSNIFGSQALYAADLGLPYFLYGSNDLYLNNRGNDSVALGKNSLKDYVHKNRKMDKYDEANRIFTEFSEEVTPQQKAFANEALGIHETVSPLFLSYIFWKEYLLYGLSKKIHKYFKRHNTECHQQS